jgi:putative transposase
MANTYYSLNIHCIFSTKDRQPWITGELEEPLPSYMAGILRKHDVKPLCVGGTSDHVHVLMSLPTTISIAKAVQLLKGSSSKWIHESFPNQKAFGW